jgi:penicillin-binding protein 1A
VWFGNDDYKTMNQMTGGSLPAQTWHEIMAYAHQGIELKPIPGLGPQSQAPARVAAAAPGKGDAPQRPSLLTRRGADILIRVERLMDDATRALATRDELGRKAESTDPSKRADASTAPDREPNVRGN